MEFKSRIKTSNDDSNKGQYEFKNFATGMYVVRYEYGNSEETLKYNGQDYKNTSYQTGMLNTGDEIGTSNVPGQLTLNNEWHDLSNNLNAELLENARVSDARDYEPRRMKVMAYSRTITNENAEVLSAYINDQSSGKINEEYREILEANKDKLIENTAMVANTAKFNVEIEKQNTITYKTVETTKGDENGSTKHEYQIKNIDFGLVERPETRINLKKEISKIELMKNDGQETILSVECDDEGNIIKNNNGQGSNINKVTEIKKSDLTQGSQGFKYIAMEASYLKGLQVRLTYKITATNNSETDYVGEKIAELKSTQDLYDQVVNYETNDSNQDGLVSFNTGEGIVYGKYVGLHYYTNEISQGDGAMAERYGYSYAKDEVVKTTIDQLVDYIDNDISIDKENSENVVDCSWIESTDIDRNNKFSSISYKDNKKEDKNFVDNKGRSYIGDNKNNLALTENENIECTKVTYQKARINDKNEPVINSEGMPEMDEVSLDNVYTAKQKISSSTTSSYNPEMTTQLEPGQSKSMYIVLSAQANEEAINNMNYDNLVEVAIYSNSVGRRDMQTIPGNANMIAKQHPTYKAGSNWDVEVGIADKNGSTTQVTTERDSYAAKDTITFSEPTGLSLGRQQINKAVRIILIVLIIAAITIIITTICIVAKKTKYEDNELLNYRK